MPLLCTAALVKTHSWNVKNELPLKKYPPETRKSLRNEVTTKQANLRQRSNDFPVISCEPRRSHGRPRLLRSSFRVDIRRIFFCVSCTGQDNVRHAGTEITMRTWKPTKYCALLDRLLFQFNKREKQQTGDKTNSKNYNCQSFLFCML